ncbi:hypothetical protein HH214_00235 [Mucilaginibacter robiniae]|uniref:O-antigen ligase domain-containing protein n=1 Tax=Mucilaginibacter robiniae TaxID=2728022 RepID=A0A7L5DTI8_9SPHI|nr:hypothetical protein [Mucilaginibacter robiniae]QJD94410.1 hypothetical protein HH214_00235 [Mucilaginibacter robiniae]
MVKPDSGKIINFLMLLVTVNSINQWSRFELGGTFVWWAINLALIIAVVKAKKKYYDTQNNRNTKFLVLYLVWNAICIVRGMFVADNYWEWKNLVGNAMLLLTPLVVYVATNKELVQSIFSTWLKYALPAFILFLPIIAYPDAFGRYLVPIGFFLLFFPVLSKKWKIISFVLTIIVIFSALDARSNVIKFSSALLLSFVYLFRNTIWIRFLGLTRWLLLIVPIVLFCLAVSGKFNVFKMDEYIKGDYTTTSVVEGGGTEEANLTTDTRTFLYEEVLSSAVKYSYIWLGRTPARGNESASFGEYAMEVLKTGKMERPYNEVAILNTFTWTGVVGVVLSFLVYFWASFLAVARSNNTIMRILGVCVAFRWAYGWVEDFSAFDLSYLYLWIMIGMCISQAFREMDDAEMENWILGIFDKRYRNLDLYLQSSTLINNKYQDTTLAE